MAFDFIYDRKTYFDWQYRNAVSFIVPFVKNHITPGPSCRVLEVGCCDGGVLKAFTDLGCTAVGMDIYAPSIEDAKKNMEPEVEKGLARFFAKDVYDIDKEKDFKGLFDLVILKDVLEHIPNQHNLMQLLRTFLKKEGCIFLGFPPWQMPFGGHQQGCQNYFLSRLPWYPLLPAPIYQYEFGLNTRIVYPLLTKIPVLRNFYTTGIYYLVRPH